MLKASFLTDFEHSLPQLDADDKRAIDVSRLDTAPIPGVPTANICVKASADVIETCKGLPQFGKWLETTGGDDDSTQR